MNIDLTQPDFHKTAIERGCFDFYLFSGAQIANSHQSLISEFAPRFLGIPTLP